MTPFRRHSDECPLKKDGRRAPINACKCVFHVKGTLTSGVYIQQRSLHTSSLAAAKQIIADWQKQGGVNPAPSPETTGTSIVDAVNRYLVVAENNRQVELQTAYNYRRCFLELENNYRPNQRTAMNLETFCKTKGIRFIEQVTLDDIEELQRSWKGFEDTTVALKTSLIKSLWRFFNRKGISALDISDLPIPKTKANTRPFDQDEMRRILAAAASKNPIDYALVLFMRYSGLRISDAVRSGKNRLVGNKLILRQQKTDEWVTVELPQPVLNALEQFKPKTPVYWFWNGHDTLKTIRQHWYKRLKSVFKCANVQGHPHMLRDTFAVESLVSGMDVKDVSELLGHSSIRTTEKHYLYWVKQRQLRVDEQMRKVHANDPILSELGDLAKKAGTNRVHLMERKKSTA